MRRAIWMIPIASLAMGAAVYLEAAEESAEKSGGLPPLKVDRSAPLLLEESPAESPLAKARGPVADNSACYVCHANYEEEEMVVQHALEEVGCIDCHGPSYDHRDDEDNVTPPDVMYAPDKIEAACQECHDTHDAPAVKIIRRWQERAATKDDPDKLVCTDCHGRHRLKSRTVRWNKTTGELIRPHGR